MPTACMMGLRVYLPQVVRVHPNYTCFMSRAYPGGLPRSCERLPGALREAAYK